MAKKPIFEAENPVMNFISQPQEEAEAKGKAKKESPAPKAQPKVPAGYKLDPTIIETKSKRVQLLMQPSLYAKVKKLADKKGVSLNEFIHEAMEKAVTGKEG